MSREFLQLDDNLFVNPSAVCAVKRASENSCTVFFKGQSAQDGFVVNITAEDVVEEIEESLAEDE